jgi:hypothetical protein
VRLVGGTFAPSTPRTIHVPAGFMVIVTASTDGSRARMSVLSPSTAQTFSIRANDTLRITLDSLRPGASAKLAAGGRTVRIAADAEPGP